jgi:ATP diphosphatase
MKFLQRLLRRGSRPAAPPQQREQGHGLLDGIAAELSALPRALALQQRAAAVGFDWPDAASVLGKLDEERRELDLALRGAGRVEDELGDLFFTLVNLSRLLGLDPERVLDAANAKFARRFRYMETLAGGRGVSLDSLSMEALERLWENSKAELRKKKGALASTPE